MAQMRFLAQSELAQFQESGQPTLIRVTSGEQLNAEVLRNDIAPTLAGIDLVGQGVSQATRREYQGTVSSISQDSPISINLTGLKETVDLVLSYVNLGAEGTRNVYHTLRYRSVNFRSANRKTTSLFTAWSMATSP
jgi:hypothetical protein